MRKLLVVPAIVAGLSAFAGVAYASGDDVPGSLGKGPVFDPAASAGDARPKVAVRDMEGAGQDDARARSGHSEHRDGERSEGLEGGMEDD